MSFRRSLVGALVTLAAVVSTLAAAPPGTAGSLDGCAERVLRDWYSGGRIDDVYPLACYRAALRSLPDDVLQYSNADQDIRRALAFARRGRNDPGNRAAAPRPAAAAPEKPAAASTPTKARPPAAPKPPVAAVAAPVSKAPVVAETRSTSPTVPYPIIALAALAGILLVAGAVGGLARRR